MDRFNNPYAPGAGTPPPALVGRTDLIDDVNVMLSRIKNTRPAKSMLLVGLRGVGKTVLLNHIQNHAEELGYKTIFIEAPEDKRLPSLLIPPLRHLLLQLSLSKNVNDKARKAFRLLMGFAKGLKFSFHGMEVGFDPEIGADSGALETDLPVLMMAVAEAARENGTPILLLIDEMQYLTEEELSALIMAAHKISQKQLPMVFVGAGLPQLVGNSGESKSYAERLFEFPEIGALKNDDAVKALTDPAKRENVEYTEDALKKIILLTKGYPYFLQEWGYHAWNTASSSPISLEDIDNATSRVIKGLDESFFRVRFDRLTQAEKKYLRAMAELGPGPHKSGDIAQQLKREVQSVAPTRSILIKKGMIYSPTHGDTAFTVPLFDQFMKRIMPTIE